jgi:hypothetical protein
MIITGSETSHRRLKKTVSRSNLSDGAKGYKKETTEELERKLLDLR